MLKEAGEKLGGVLEGITLGKIETPYLTNVTGKTVTEVSQVKETFGKAGVLFGEMAAVRGADDPGRYRYFYRDRTGKDAHRIFKKDKPECNRHQH